MIWSASQKMTRTENGLVHGESWEDSDVAGEVMMQ